MGVTERMAEFIVETKWADFPALAIERAKKAAVDTVGVTLAGVNEPVGRIVADFARKMGGAPEASIIGLGERAAAPLAALVNGAIGHALDFDDSSYLLSGHPSVVVLPAVLAQGEKQGASGREVLEAFIIGYEISTKLGLGMNPEHYGAGWHSTCTLGTLGAAAAAAHLRGFDVETTRHALGIAASHASGVHANFGTMTKPLHAGLAPEAGLRAAELAAAGLTANTSILEAPRGFLQVYAGGGAPDADGITQSLGRPYSLADPGMNMKPYPCCLSTHPAVDALYDLVEEAGITAADVARIEVSLLEISTQVLRYHAPQTGLEGKFSIEYCLARMLLDRDLRLETFTDEAVREPLLQDWMKKIHVTADDMGWRPGERRPSEVRVCLNDGRVLKKRTDVSRGCALWPMEDTKIRSKFRDCAKTTLAADEYEEVLALLESFETQPEIDSLMALLGGAGAREQPVGRTA